MKLDDLWEENAGAPILYTWIDFLKNETLNYLEITNFLDIRGIFTHDLRMRSRRAFKDNHDTGPSEKPDFWEERKRFWNERKNRKLQKPSVKKKYPRPCRRSGDRSDTISALYDAQDCESSSSEIINMNDENTTRRLVDLKTDDNVVVSVSPSQTSSNLQDKNDFEKSVRDKFGIEIKKPVYLSKIKLSAIPKFKERVERKKTSNNIIALLINFNEDRTLSEFKKGFYDCDICFQVFLFKYFSLTILIIN